MKVLFVRCNKNFVHLKILSICRLHCLDFNQHSEVSWMCVNSQTKQEHFLSHLCGKWEWKHIMFKYASVSVLVKCLRIMLEWSSSGMSTCEAVAVIWKGFNYKPSFMNAQATKKEPSCRVYHYILFLLLLFLHIAKFFCSTVQVWKQKWNRIRLLETFLHNITKRVVQRCVLKPFHTLYSAL